MHSTSFLIASVEVWESPPRPCADWTSTTQTVAAIVAACEQYLTLLIATWIVL